MARKVTAGLVESNASLPRPMGWLASTESAVVPYAHPTSRWLPDLVVTQVLRHWQATGSKIFSWVSWGRHHTRGLRTLWLVFLRLCRNSFSSRWLRHATTNRRWSATSKWSSANGKVSNARRWLIVEKLCCITTCYLFVMQNCSTDYKNKTFKTCKNIRENTQSLVIGSACVKDTLGHPSAPGFCVGTASLCFFQGQ